jgi:hypothetical protein
MNLIKPECLAKYEAWAKTVFRNSAAITDSVGKGFRSVKKDILDSIDFSKLNKDSWVIVPNDFDLTMTKEFYARGITNLVFLTTDMSDEQAANNYFFNIVYNSPRFKSLLVEDKLPWKAIVRLTKKVTPKLNKKGEVTDKFIEELTLEGDTEYMPKKFGAITANFPFSEGNNITTFIVNEIDFEDEGFVNVLPISKYKKGNLTQHIVLGSIKNNKRGRETSDFDGADTYPVICKLSRTKTNDLSFADFERLWCVNREEGLGKKFFEEQDRRIAAEESGARPKAFVEQICGGDAKQFKDLNVNITISTNLWTPHIAHGWGAQEIYSDATTQTLKSSSAKGGNYIDWNFRKVTTPYTEVFNVTANGSIGQTVTIMNTEAGKDHMLKWMHSAEISGKYRHCGLFTILLRWMNKSTCCPYDYILPRVDWDSRDWTDEEILKDYGYTDEEIENILHYNDDLVPDSWASKLSKKD